MNVFKKMLIKKGLDNILDYVEYTPLSFINESGVFNAIDDILKNNRKTLLYGDYDTDGAACQLEWKHFFQQVHFSNYSIFKYAERTHLLDSEAVRQAIEGHYEYIVVSDTGTNEFAKINELLLFGVKVIILDHHRPQRNYRDYPSNCFIINSCLETDLVVSAGALVFHVLNAYAIRKNLEVNLSKLSIYALISMYADCIDMSPKLNRALYYKALNDSLESLPLLVKSFIPSYQSLCRRTIEFNFTPKMNCGFRQELFDLLNTILYEPESLGNDNLLQQINYLSEMHLQSAARTTTVADIIDVTEMNTLVLANLDSVSDVFNINDTKLYNYTGLVANKLSQKYGKAAVVWCNRGNLIKGSFRDLQSRNYLEIFKQFCTANGHNPAFGLEIQPSLFGRFFRILKKIDINSKVVQPLNNPIILNVSPMEITKDLICDMAKYNEFAGSIPVALVNIRIDNSFIKKASRYRGSFHYKINGITVSSGRCLNTNTTVLLKPTYGKQLKLYSV